VEKARRGLKLKIRNRNIDEFHTATGRSPEKIAQDQERERVFHGSGSATIRLD
jgi:hypothetical protein